MKILFYFPLISLGSEVSGSTCQPLDIVVQLRRRGHEVTTASYARSDRVKHIWTDVVLNIKRPEEIKRRFGSYDIIFLANLGKKGDDVDGWFSVVQVLDLPHVLMVHDEGEVKAQEGAAVHDLLESHPKFRGYVMAHDTIYDALNAANQRYANSIVYAGYDAREEPLDTSEILNKHSLLVSTSRITSQYGIRELARMSKHLLPVMSVESWGHGRIYHYLLECKEGNDYWNYLGGFDRSQLPEILANARYHWAFYWARRGTPYPRVGASVLEAMAWGCIPVMVEGGIPTEFTPEVDCVAIPAPNQFGEDWRYEAADRLAYASKNSDHLAMARRARRIVDECYRHEPYVSPLISWLQDRL